MLDHLGIHKIIPYNLILYIRPYVIAVLLKTQLQTVTKTPMLLNVK